MSRETWDHNPAADETRDVDEACSRATGEAGEGGESETESHHTQHQRGG